MSFVADFPIKVVVLPKRPLPSENPVRFFRGVALPGMEDFAHRRLPDFNKDVNVVRHDHPRQQPVLHAVVMPQIALRKRGDARVAHGTLAVALIEIGFNPALFFLIVLQFQESFPFRAARGWQCVGEAIGDELLPSGIGTSKILNLQQGSSFFGRSLSHCFA